VCH
ncbi:hypothetical protein EC951288_1031B, partial [Escherichia coli 95.1288]